MSRVTAREELAATTLVAVLVVLVAQVALVLFPILYELGEDWDYLSAGLVALALYAAPLLAGLTSWLPRSSGLRLGAGACVVALVVVCVVEPIPLAVTVLATVLVLAGGATVAVHLPCAGGLPRRGLLSGLVLGLALHTTVSSPWQGWPLPWQKAAPAWAVSVAIGLGVLVLAWRSARRREHEAGGTRGGGWMGSALVVSMGPFLALQVLFLQNPGFVASQSRLSFETAAQVVLSGDLAALLAIVAMARRRSSRLVVAFGTVVATVSALGLPRIEGPLVLLVVLALQVLLAGGLAVAAGDAEAHAEAEAEAEEGGVRAGGGLSLWSAAAGTAAASVIFLALVLAWQLDVVRPLPFPRALVPGLAAVLVGVPALFALRSPSRMAPPVPLVPALAAALVLALALAVPVALRLGKPALLAQPPPDGTVRLVSWNIRSAVGIGGQLRPDRIAQEIRSSDPDVVVLQEVSRGTPISDATDVLAYLQRRLDMPYLFAPAADRQFGNAVLSRLPISLLSSGPLPDDGGQRRSALAVRLDVAGTPLVLVDAHLGGRSIRQIAAARAATGGASPAVIAGDLNVAPNEPEAAGFAGLVDVVAATGDRCRATSAQPVRSCDRPDWVLLTPDLAIVDVRIGTSPASDHLPVHVAVRLPPG